MTRRELFAIIHFATGKFSYYLLYQEFTLRKDHSSLRWLDSFYDNATDVLARWLHYLEPFRLYMTILYGPGKMHSNADELSRIDTRPCPCEDCLTMAISLRRINHLLRRNLGYCRQSKLEVRMVIVT